MQAVIGANYEPPPAVSMPHNDSSDGCIPPAPKSFDSEVDDGDIIAFLRIVKRTVVNIRKPKAKPKAKPPPPKP